MQDLLKEIVPEAIERPSKLPEELRKADKATATSPEAKPEKTHRVKFFRRIFRFNKATSTQEDQQSPDPSRPPAKGPDPKNMKGPSSRNILYVHIHFTCILYLFLLENLFVSSLIKPSNALKLPRIMIVPIPFPLFLNLTPYSIVYVFVLKSV